MLKVVEPEDIFSHNQVESITCGHKEMKRGEYNSKMLCWKEIYKANQ